MVKDTKKNSTTTYPLGDYPELFLLKKVVFPRLQRDIIKLLLPLVSKDEIERIGRLSNFVKRKSKLTAYRFLLALVFSRFDGDKLSLNDLCNDLDNKFNCGISKQSIDERFTLNAVEFIKQVINNGISKKLAASGNIPLLGHFNAVRLQDSTSFQIPKDLSGDYGGCGGNATGALARVQFEYDLKAMNMDTLELTPGSYQDVSFSKDNVGSINKNDLVIRDLGYISGAFLKGVISQEAYFLNRLRANQTVYTQDGHGDYRALDFSGLLRKMDRNKIRSTELEIFLNVEGEYIKMRLIVEKMPEDIYAERIRKAEKEAKKKKHKLSKEYKVRAQLNLFVTNVEEGVLQTKEIGYIYSLRWQIELMFKSWKSTFALAKVKKMKKYRFECQLYARLLLIIISWKMFSAINAHIMAGNSPFQSPVIISYYKFNKLIYACLESFLLSIINKGKMLDEFIQSIIRISLSDRQDIEPKNNTISSLHIFEMIAYHTDNEYVDVDDIA